MVMVYLMDTALASTCINVIMCTFINCGVSNSHFLNFPKSCSNLSIFRCSNFQIPNFQKVRYTGFQQNHNFIRLSDTNIFVVKDAPIYSCIFRSVLVINAGSEGPELVTISVVPKKFQKILQSIRNH